MNHSRCVGPHVTANTRSALVAERPDCEPQPLRLIAMVIDQYAVKICFADRSSPGALFAAPSHRSSSFRWSPFQPSLLRQGICSCVRYPSVDLGGWGGYGVAAEALGELNHPPRVQLVESECSDFAADSFPSIAAIGSVLRPSPHRPASLRQRSAHCAFFRPLGAGYALQIRMMRAVGSPAPGDIHPAPDGFIEIAVVRAILREISSLSPTSGRGAVTGPVAFSAISSKAPHKWSNSLSFGNYL